MNSLLASMQTKNNTTENGMLTNTTSLNNCVDLFFTIGAMRGQDKSKIINAFTKAFGEDKLTAMRLLFWARDIRGGAGERQIFKDIIKYLANNHTEVMRKNIDLISEFGRWDDVLILLGTKLENDALNLIKKGLDNNDLLCYKWMPRPNVKNREDKRNANIIRKYLKLDPKEYRKLLSEKSKTVEQLMCSNNWSEIEYSKLPSKAMSDLMSTFTKHDGERFNAYLECLKNGETKINTGAIYPYDVIKNMNKGNIDGSIQQWNSLPNYMGENKERVLPLVDVSASMDCQAGNNPNLTCMAVAISLGLYISERNVGAFKDAFITFSTQPQLEVVKGTLYERYEQMLTSDWGGSTNLQAVFKLILDKAVSNNVPESDMPTMLIILSDMEFNEAIRHEDSWDVTAQEMIEKMYSEAGYKVPKMVYWNINARNSNKPVTFDKNGTCLVSGFSPALLVNLLSGKDMTPYSIMLDVINSERYLKVTI